MSKTPAIYLADLRHNYTGVLANDCMPLGVAYLKAVMDRDLPEVHSRLFAYPHRLHDASRRIRAERALHQRDQIFHRKNRTNLRLTQSQHRGSIRKVRRVRTVRWARLVQKPACQRVTRVCTRRTPRTPGTCRT